MIWFFVVAVFTWLAIAAYKKNWGDAVEAIGSFVLVCVYLTPVDPAPFA